MFNLLLSICFGLNTVFSFENICNFVDFGLQVHQASPLKAQKAKGPVKVRDSEWANRGRLITTCHGPKTSTVQNQEN